MTDEEAKRMRDYEDALKKIAALNDVGANERLAATGSYGRFDEPESVEIAREALGMGGFRMPTKEVTGETI